MLELSVLSAVLDRRFDAHVRAIDPEAPTHRVEFSPRITESWALIYYRRRLVRLSPYLFLLDAADLKHGSHWRELDATLRHEAAHAVAFYRTGETGHGPAFHEALGKLGHRANGTCDLGPENAAYRYVYACPSCGTAWERRAKLRGNFSCGACAPGRYVADHRLVLREVRDLPALLGTRNAWVAMALAEAQDAGEVMRPAQESPLCDAPLSSVMLPRAPPAFP